MLLAVLFVGLELPLRPHSVVGLPTSECFIASAKVSASSQSVVISTTGSIRLEKLHRSRITAICSPSLDLWISGSAHQALPLFRFLPEGLHSR